MAKSIKAEQFNKALNTLFLALKKERDEFIRDSIIQRFEYTTELFWKFLKEYLFEIENIEVLSPNNTMRECRNTGIFSEEETEYAIGLMKDRNLSSHAYNEDLANTIVSKIDDYAIFMQNTYKKLEK